VNKQQEKRKWSTAPEFKTTNLDAEAGENGTNSTSHAAQSTKRRQLICRVLGAFLTKYLKVTLFSLLRLSLSLSVNKQFEIY
jgi:hypothetical protein